MDQRHSLRVPRILLDLVLLAAIGGTLYELGRMRIAIERPWLERDLDRVFAAIPQRYDYERLDRWCGLRQTAATPSEVATIRKALRIAPDPKRVWCTRLADYWMWAFPDEVRPPERAKWVRLHHPTDPHRWIGLGVLDVYSTGRTDYWIVCRVSVGF